MAAGYFITTITLVASYYYYYYDYYISILKISTNDDQSNEIAHIVKFPEES